MSQPQIVPFPATPSEPEAPGIASRTVQVNGVRWALVEYEPGVLREEWCDEGHSGYALDGEVEYEFQGNGRPPLAVRAGRASRCRTAAVTAGGPARPARASS